MPGSGRISPVETSPERFEDFYLREYPAVVGLAFALSGSRWAARRSRSGGIHRGAPQLGPHLDVRPPGGMGASSGREPVRLCVPPAGGGGEGARPDRLRAGRDAGFRGGSSRVLGGDPGPPPTPGSGRGAPLPGGPLGRRDRRVSVAVTHGTVKRHLHDGRRSLARRLSPEEAMTIDRRGERAGADFPASD